MRGMRQGPAGELVRRWSAEADLVLPTPPRRAEAVVPGEEGPHLRPPTLHVPSDRGHGHLPWGERDDIVADELGVPLAAALGALEDDVMCRRGGRQPGVPVTPGQQAPRPVTAGVRTGHHVIGQHVTASEKRGRYVPSNVATPPPKEKRQKGESCLVATDARPAL